ncbi:MAG: methyltransferase domain-containing protein [Chitinophagaceae bacterium]|nr:methyltransferase domain-containing protein [Chitinophagaceae bacterium]
MKVSSNDLYTGGEYFKNNPDWDIGDAGWKSAVIVDLLKKNNIAVTEVIETGCGAGGILAALAALDPGIKKLTGYDISPQAIELARKNESGRIRFFNADITAEETAQTELMLVIDVVEHVDDYYGFLRKLRPKSKYFMFHIPLDLSCRTVMKPHVMLQQRQAVGHIHYFTRETAEWALHDTGYEIIDWVYTKPVVDVQPADSLKRFVKKILRNISFAVNKEWSVKKWGGYSIMALAK